MKIVRSIPELSLDRTRRVGLVPTMGAFHQGHLELMRAARRECDICVVSLFVNPTQFGPGEDYSSYPRQEQADLSMAQSEGVDVVFLPSAEEMYGEASTSVHVSGPSELWEGEYRPSHFVGVATVVAKLFNIVDPEISYFGLKDFQQCAVISRMVHDLNFRVQLRFVDTVREPDGLAMSSRNVRLTPEDRKKASQLYQSLESASRQLRANPKDQDHVHKVLMAERSSLESIGFQVDYFALVDARTLKPAAFAEGSIRLIAAARIGGVRLIDNIAV